MKLSVSTLGCPTWTLDEILTRCSLYGYDAVELRGIGADLDLSQTADFATPAALAATQRRFGDAGLAISAVDSSAQLANVADPEKNLDQGRASIDLAIALGAPYVRVFGGANPDEVPRPTAVRQLADSLAVLGDYALSNGGVTVVLETHDAFSTGAQVAEALNMISHPYIGALWDLHHPFRHDEAPDETARLLGSKVRFTHVKDSRPGETYCLLGEGDIPVRECFKQLRDLGYQGYVSVEWEKRWIPALLEPEIVFPQYAKKLREYLDELGNS